MAGKDIMNRILNRFDFDNSLKLAFGYGSAVFTQRGNPSGLKGRRNMIDICLVVDNPVKFHSRNVNKNPNDYSFLGKYGLSTSKVFHQMAAGVYINTLIALDDGNMFKYGVISSQEMKNDLTQWSTLFYAGRLHKPVKFLTNNSDFNQELQTNLKMAWNTACLLSSEPRCTLREVFTTLAGISYHGDFRMIFGEDKHKVVRIVDSSFDHFSRLYLPIIKEDSFSSLTSGSSCVELDLSSRALEHRLSLLPQRFFKDVSIAATKEPFSIQQNLRRELERTVWKSSLLQSLKNIPTAGLSKSAIYSIQKITKMHKNRPSS